MIDKAIRNLGVDIYVKSQSGERISTTCGQIKILKTTAQKQYENVTELGVCNREIYVFLGNSAQGIEADNILEHNGVDYLILKTETRRQKGASLTWAALRKPEVSV